MSDFVNTRLDRYQIQERIGTGGMARVYKAWDTNLDRAVAVKILHEHLADDPTFKERFEREAKFVASLNHPNIVQVYDFNVIERDGFPMCYMVMPFIPGMTLRDVLEQLAAKDEIMSYERALEITFNLIDALGYAHTAGMVHRDVKPANVMLNELGQAVLTDFGIARLAASTRLTQDGVSTGTPAYMSPEQANGLPGDARSDLYALGVILFELITGRLPYDDRGGVSLMLAHLNAPIPRISDFMPQPNAALDAFFTRALAKAPDDRYASAQAFAEDLRAAFSDLVTSFPRSVTGSASGFTTSPRPASTATMTMTSPAAPAPQASGVNRLLAAVAIVGAIAILVTGIVLTRPTASAAPDVVNSMTGSSASMTGDLFFLSQFDEDDAYLPNWTQGTLGDFLQEITPEGLYHLRKERPGTVSTSIFNPNYVYANASISMQGTLEADSSPAGAFGIVFRYRDQDHYNVFAVDGLGRFSIWVRDEGVWTELRQRDEEWTQNDVIRPMGEENTLLVDVLGNRITASVNGTEVTRVVDDTFADGNVGIYIATASEGITGVLIDMYQVYPAAPPSMTADSR